MGGATAGALDVADHSLFEPGPHPSDGAAIKEGKFKPPQPTEESGAFQSIYMHRSVGWTLSRPPGPAPAEGIVFCLHGYHQDHRVAFDAVKVPDAAAAVGLRVAVAAVDGGADSYWHRRADGTDALAMFLLEFVPRIRAEVGDVPQALMGWSMGGYGALLAAERDPAAFSAVAPASPALWITPGATAPGAFDGPTDFFANDVFTGVARLQRMAVAVACGTGDPFYTATRSLVARMGFPHTTFFGPGSHDVSYWKGVAPQQLQVIAGSLRGGSPT